ncbi:MAG TPA: MOSC domain-containing protein, partial [Candidatus Bathyarchaeia archaeon]|nr:MOSC domain-containing protein [Candidatus Bathyarchaeia archaeon]
MLVKDLSEAALKARLEEIRRAPGERGRVELVVRRPREREREILAQGVLDPVEGLLGDTWRVRGSRQTADGSAHPGMQLTVMSSRAAALVAGPVERWPLAGDQLYVDFDLSEATLPPGAQLGVGEAIVEITAQPHLGCAKFAERFGPDALRLVNSTVGRELRLRGVNTRILVGGVVRPGDAVLKLDVA